MNLGKERDFAKYFRKRTCTWNSDCSNARTSSYGRQTGTLKCLESFSKGRNDPVVLSQKSFAEAHSLVSIQCENVASEITKVSSGDPHVFSFTSHPHNAVNLSYLKITSFRKDRKKIPKFEIQYFKKVDNSSFPNAKFG